MSATRRERTKLTTEAITTRLNPKGHALSREPARSRLYEVPIMGGVGAHSMGVMCPI